MNVTDILSREEIAAVLKDLRKRGKRSLNSRLNLVIFRLSCCCGLRAKEIVGINLRDIVVGGPRPTIRIRKEVTKGEEGKRRARLVPLWWDSGTRDDIADWVKSRFDSGAGPNDPVVCGCAVSNLGQRLDEGLVAHRWRTAIKVLGPDRVRQLHLHCGRHSFCSHAIGMGRSLVEVRDAAGHRNIDTTSIYLHVLERSGIPDLFSFDKETE